MIHFVKPYKTKAILSLALLLGMIRSLATRRTFDEVAEPLTEDMNLAISTLFERIGT